MSVCGSSVELFAREMALSIWPSSLTPNALAWTKKTTSSAVTSFLKMRRPSASSFKRSVLPFKRKPTCAELCAGHASFATCRQF